MNRTDINSLLKSYPRRRPELPAEQRRIYEQEYRINRDGTSTITRLSRAMETWLHRQIMRPAGNKEHETILELGAGTLNHLQYEDNFNAYDVVEPFTALYENSDCKSQVRNFYPDISAISGLKYDRIISKACFEHILDLPAVIRRCAMLLDDGGILQVSIPTEGSPLWKLAYTLTTGLAYRLRTGLSYEPLMRYEHVNRADEIEALIRHYFADVKVRRFPTGLYSLSFYTYLEARSPRDTLFTDNSAVTGTESIK